jgi:NitT/TauT family transport system substrate-binding protein
MDPASSGKTIQAVQKFDKDSTIATLQEQLEITRILVHPNPAVALGTIDVPAWKQTEQILLDQKQIPATVGIEKYLIPVPKY